MKQVYHKPPRKVRNSLAYFEKKALEVIVTKAWETIKDCDVVYNRTFHDVQIAKHATTKMGRLVEPQNVYSMRVLLGYRTCKTKKPRTPQSRIVLSHHDVDRLEQVLARQDGQVVVCKKSVNTPAYLTTVDSIIRMRAQSSAMNKRRHDGHENVDTKGQSPTPRVDTEQDQGGRSHSAGLSEHV